MIFLLGVVVVGLDGGEAHAVVLRERELPISATKNSGEQR
jgi:hypothetical protein